jgi:hypothetical protein
VVSITVGYVMFVAVIFKPGEYLVGAHTMCPYKFGGID